MFRPHEYLLKEIKAQTADSRGSRHSVNSPRDDQEERGVNQCVDTNIEYLYACMSQNDKY
jgi:hypothetical protein